ncbi:MAG: C39 family peptidase [Sphingomonas fennica]
MQLPGITKKIIGMCYNVKGVESSFSRSDASITLRVPFIAQRHVNLCTDATAAMIVQAWGYRTRSNTLRNERSIFGDASIADHREIAEAGTCHWMTMQPPKDVSSAMIVDWLTQYGPLGLSVRSRLGGHAVCIVGAYANNDQIIVHDPWTGPHRTLNFADVKPKINKVNWLTKVGQTKLARDSAAWAS